MEISLIGGLSVRRGRARSLVHLRQNERDWQGRFDHILRKRARPLTLTGRAGMNRQADPMANIGGRIGKDLCAHQDGEWSIPSS
jgi:hypothetical protein